MKLHRWKYDTAWARIITRDKNGIQAVVMDQVESNRGQVLVKKANRFIKIKNIMSGRIIL